MYGMGDLSMNKMPSEEDTSLKEYLESSITQITKAMGEKAKVEGTITIELTTGISKGKGGGLRISVLNIGAEVSEHEVQKIVIPVKILSERDRLTEEYLLNIVKRDLKTKSYLRELPGTTLGLLGFYLKKGDGTR